MFSFPQLLLLGGFAGFTIFLGLPLAAIQQISPRKKEFLNAVAIGILIFLTIDVLSHSWQSTEETAIAALARSAPIEDAALALLAMFGGIAVALLGLTWFGTRYMKGNIAQSPLADMNAIPQSRKSSSSGRRELQLLQQVDAYRLSTMIAIGIGVHNFSEGLAIGQSYASGAIGLALILVIGFAAHNATEGFGIAAPLAGLSKRPSYRFIIMTGLLGGGPTFMGTALGSVWMSTTLYIFFLSIAGGALLHVALTMYNAGRHHVTNNILMTGLFLGLLAGFITDLLVTIAGA
jgi:ZIP family zinc transporter